MLAAVSYTGETSWQWCGKNEGKCKTRAGDMRRRGGSDPSDPSFGSVLHAREDNQRQRMQNVSVFEEANTQTLRQTTCMQCYIFPSRTRHLPDPPNATRPPPQAPSPHPPSPQAPWLLPPACSHAHADFRPE